jgi:hypothetical protein
MAVVEILAFRLAPAVDESEFLDADRRVQSEFIPNHPGFLRRTTARNADGDWLVVTLWLAEADAVASERLSADHPAALAFISLVDGGSVRMKRFTTLD